ncbi:hypothetical protein Vi05172_g7127 [Venturia inaequalis]|uniref:Uncharacterized protein n=1 Tax=Venturia inaequalis TaxID=5025 RepID=A0A8H3V6A4_VENIN|nr:hypothetical protein EG327_006037 [Venturia inaequalis]RDI82896.1 hypothetical protein Vi05172_g7127 [Venturia inaequalis]
MQFLSITTVLVNLVLLQGVAAQSCAKNPTDCSNSPCSETYNNAAAICQEKVWLLLAYLEGVY